jgi:hypothetical protein
MRQPEGKNRISSIQSVIFVYGLGAIRGRHGNQRLQKPRLLIMVLKAAYLYLI